MNAILHLEDFTFDEDAHVYRDEREIIVMSATQYLSMAGIYDFSMVPDWMLKAAQERGKNVHAWTMRHDRALMAGASLWQAFDEADPLSVSEKELARCEGWVQFVKDFKPRFIDIESGTIRTIRGKKVAGTPDRVVQIASRYATVDLKTAASFHPGWPIQIAIYEMLRTGREFVGSMDRISVRLPESGRYAIKTYDEMSDADVGIACLHPDDPHCRQIVETWLRNHKLTIN